MVIYAESSAVVSRLFREARAADVVTILESAERVVASALTLIECSRALHRIRSLGVISAAQTEILLSEFALAAAQWDVLEIRERVVRLASGPFPAEPVRALDAIHLASVILAREVWPDLAVLSLDGRVRANVESLGLIVVPEAR